MILALDFLPCDEVANTYNILKNFLCQNLLPVLEFFAETYIIGRPGRGRRKHIPPWYPPQLWNQHSAALTDGHKTNNISEGWHNRFRLVIGKHHSDLYSAFTEFKKEQVDTEITIAELSLGRKVKTAPKRKWLDHQLRIKKLLNNLKIIKMILHITLCSKYLHLHFLFIYFNFLYFFTLISYYCFLHAINVLNICTK